MRTIGAFFSGQNPYARPIYPCEGQNVLIAGQLALDPIVEPVRLVSGTIMDCSARGDIVLGRGMTVIAAERTGRRCYGLIDPMYVDTVVCRWQSLTGDKARNATNGWLFDELESDRRCNDNRLLLSLRGSP